MTGTGDYSHLYSFLAYQVVVGPGLTVLDYRLSQLLFYRYFIVFN